MTLDRVEGSFGANQCDDRNGLMDTPCKHPGSQPQHANSRHSRRVLRYLNHCKWSVVAFAWWQNLPKDETAIAVVCRAAPLAESDVFDYIEGFYNRVRSQAILTK